MKQVTRTLAVMAFACGLTATAHAQIGSGWISVPREGGRSATAGSYYSNSGGIETFQIFPGSSRSEWHLGPNYNSGQRQFEGYVRVVTASIVKSSVQQVMWVGGTQGDAQQIRAYSGGRLGVLQNGATLATNVIGTWVRINVVHVTNGSATTYANGAKKSTYNIGPNKTGQGWYFKYGVYGGESVSPKVQWKGVKSWRR